MRSCVLSTLLLTFLCALPPRLHGQEGPRTLAAREPALWELRSTAGGRPTPAALPDPAQRIGRKRFTFRGTLIGAAVGATAVTVPYVLWAERGDRLVSGSNYLFVKATAAGALLGLWVDVAGYYEE